MKKKNTKFGPVFVLISINKSDLQTDITKRKYNFPTSRTLFSWYH